MAVANKIGLRIYRLSVTEERSNENLSYSSPRIYINPAAFISGFLLNHNSPVRTTEERSWYFEEREGDASGSKGYIHYGMYGFSSKIFDDSGRPVYDRRRDDVEQLPLYYDFWTPEHADFSLFALQSFQGRSCAEAVNRAMQEEFQRLNPGLALRRRKLMPGSNRGDSIYQAGVRKLELIRRNTGGDRANAYLPNPPDTVHYTLSISARRNGILGPLGEIADHLREAKSVFAFEDEPFDEAIAEVRFGSSIRKINVLGAQGDAGVIDLTSSVTIDSNGHATYDTMKRESHDLMVEFSRVLGRR